MTNLDSVRLSSTIYFSSSADSAPRSILFNPSPSSYIESSQRGMLAAPNENEDGAAALNAVRG